MLILYISLHTHALSSLKIQLQTLSTLHPKHSRIYGFTLDTNQHYALRWRNSTTHSL